MNTEKIKRDCPRSLSLFNDRVEAADIDIVVLRDMYDFFDKCQIVVETFNDHNKGTNVWSYAVTCKKIDWFIHVGYFQSRMQAENHAFEAAFGILESSFDKLVKTCANTPPH